MSDCRICKVKLTAEDKEWSQLVCASCLDAHAQDCPNCDNREEAAKGYEGIDEANREAAEFIGLQINALTNEKKTIKIDLELPGNIPPEALEVLINESVKEIDEILGKLKTKADYIKYLHDTVGLLSVKEEVLVQKTEAELQEIVIKAFWKSVEFAANIIPYPSESDEKVPLRPSKPLEQYDA